MCIKILIHLPNAQCYNPEVMLETLKKALKEECSLETGKLLVVGVSGGPDSLSLLHGLAQAGYEMVAAHLNHGLRPEAEEDAKSVQLEAERLGVTFVSGYEDTQAFAELQSMSIEEAARHLRYMFLFSEADKRNAQAVVVGHTADDQVETVLMHLLRGAGLSGLRGMQTSSINSIWHDHIPLVRPLLNVWRDEVLSFCQTNDLQPRFDHSNLDTTYFRNRLRHELIPELENYNPRVKILFLQMANTLGSDFQVVESVVEQAWEECVLDIGEKFISVDREIFLRQLKGVQRGIIRRMIASLRSDLKNIDFRAIESAVAFANNPTKTLQKDLIAGLCIQLEDNRFWISEWHAEITNSLWPHVSQSELKLEIPGKNSLGDRWCLETELITLGENPLDQIMENPDPFVGWFASDSISAEVNVRARKPGDWFQPLGMGGRKLRITDFFINIKLPKSARRNWPIIIIDDKIAWIPGHRIGHQFRITEDTNQAVKFRLFKETADA